MPRIITLLTDFGLSDGFVAAMKGAILGIAPDAVLVDVAHNVPPQDIYAGAFILSTAHEAFPPDTVHVVVVDPGVGSARNAVALETSAGIFLAPDNGMLSYLLEQYTAPLPVHPPPPPFFQAPVPAPFKAFALQNQRLFRAPVSNTFHGRDIFAPVAAHLIQGTAIEECGNPLEELVVFDIPRPYVRNGTVYGRVLHIDGYGNLISNLRAANLPSGPLRITIGGRTIPKLSTSYAEGDALLAIIGSSGYLEIAARNGSAADRLGLGRWSAVQVAPG